MGVRAKYFWIPQLIILVCGILWFSSAAFGVPVLIGWAFFGLLATLALWAYGRTRRCPSCGVPYADRLFLLNRSGLRFLGWARRVCWNCGVEPAEAEKSKTKRFPELNAKVLRNEKSPNDRTAIP